MKKVLKWLDENFEEAILVVLLVVISVLLFVNVVLRYVFKTGLVWANEICTYSFVLTAFLGVGYCIRKRSLMSMDSIKNALPFKARCIVELFVDFILAVFFGYYSYTGITTIQKAIRMGSETEILRIRLWIIYMIIFVCYVLATLRSIQKFVGDVKIMNAGEQAYLEAEAAKKAAGKYQDEEDAAV